MLVALKRMQPDCIWFS